MEDKKISEAVELLFKGAKMLAYHCPQCNMPLFKHEDKIICPACKKEAEIIGEGKNAIVRLKDDRIEERMEEEKIPKETKVERVSDVKFEDTDVETTLRKTIQIMVKRLMEISTEEEISTIKEYVEVLTSLIELFEKIRYLNI